jgi:hypothetical protein
MPEPGELFDQMMQDAFDAVEHFWGKDGLHQVAQFMTAKNRARESNRVMDELERLYGPFPDDVKGAPDHG